MKNKIAIKASILLILVLFLSGCITTGSKNTETSACGDTYAKIKTDDYALSDRAKRKLRKMNKSIAEDDDAEVRLASCNSTVTLIIKREIDKNVGKLCAMEGLSQKEIEDCKKTNCTSRMESEWCKGMTEEIKSYLDACAQFEFNSQQCTYEATTE